MSTQAPAGVQVRDLSVTYGRASAVRNVTMEFLPGVVNAVVGPNGAGKSSLLLALYGAVPSSGTVLADGTDVSGLSPAQHAQGGMAIVPQGRQIFPRLTVRENLQVMAEVLEVGRDRVEQAMERFPVLRDRRQQLAGVLSGGEQQMLAVTRALMGDASVILFDEMATGLAPKIVQELMRTARTLAESGATVIMAEPAIGTVREHIDRGYVLLRGEVVAEAEGGLELENIYKQRMGVAV